MSKNVQLNKNSINSSENNLPVNNKDSKSLDAQNQSIINNNKSIIASDIERCENGSVNSNINSNSDAATAKTDSNSIVTEIEFEVKESIKHVQFERKPIVRSGLETSGLCSIM